MNATLFCYENTKDSCIKLYRSNTALLMLYVSCVLTIVFTVIGNLLVIIAVSHFKVLHSPTNVLTLSLAVADCMIGLFILPFSSVRSVESCWYFGTSFCFFHSGLDTCLCLISVFHLCCISMDRYYAVCDPLLYPTKVTVSVAFLLAAASWIIPAIYVFVLTFSRMVEEKMETLAPELPCLGSCQLVVMRLWGWINFSIFFIPCFLMLGLYIRIFFIARRQVKIINSMTENNTSLRNGSISKRERKAAVTLGIAIGIYALCWLPFVIDTIIDAFFNFITPPLISDFLNWSTYINSACNPIIYGFFFPWFRKVLQIIFTGKIFQPGSSLINLYKE
ncbi:trace amine-associated receptor 5-like [Protopterus annectens]|uniref:trace amine-associated receptor 5-like n=1 Tax=Protopterus annectens TaxID=7888 RepID=UPI001CFC3AE7|nr:trace amine-associated receptor 5-like [Protopterus annectens]